uniref:EamA domain-containing protein n=1 Tax=Ciona savignyi TaxID=51511 RepID=H2ZJU1_CIOSA
SSDVSSVTKIVKHAAPFFGFGMLCCILSSVSSASASLLVKMVKSIGPIELLGLRCLMQFIALLPYVTYNWRRHDVDFMGPRGKFKLLCFRGVIGPCSTFCYYMSIVRLPLGDAVTIKFSSIVFSQLLGFIVLHERPTLLDILFSTIICTGVVLIAKPPFLFDPTATYDPETLYGILFGLSAAFISGVSYVTVRKLGKQTHATLNVFYYSFVGTFACLIFAATVEKFKLPCYSELLFLFLTAVAGLTTQIFMTLGLQYERAGTYTMLKTFQIILGFIFQIIILHNLPSTLSLVGACLIFSSIVGIAIRKFYKEYA